MILLDGLELTEADTGISTSERGFLLGDGLFETLRVEEGVPLLLSRHLARMARAAEEIGLPLDEECIRRWVPRAVAGIEAGSLRITVGRGPGPRGLLPPDRVEPSCLITSAPTGPRRGEAVRAIVSTVRRNEGSPISRIKSLSYQDQVLARMEAEREGAGDAVMLNNRGEPASTSCANLYALTERGWITPPVKTGLLPGIVREVLLEAGAVAEASIPPDALGQLPLARSNSLVGIEPLVMDGGADPSDIARLTDVLGHAEREER